MKHNFKPELLGYLAMQAKIAQELPRAVEYLRETQDVYIFNENGKTVCLCLDEEYAATFAKRHGLSMEVANHALVLDQERN